MQTTRKGDIVIQESVLSSTELAWWGRTASPLQVWRVWLRKGGEVSAVSRCTVTSCSCTTAAQHWAAGSYHCKPRNPPVLSSRNTASFPLSLPSAKFSFHPQINCFLFNWELSLHNMTKMMILRGNVDFLKKKSVKTDWNECLRLLKAG